uniref:SAP domain-containing protein n=1 Tax=viral metagenome TaxID=1070528 RepID=A0A6C0D0B0_9ZZZZ
MSRPCNPQSAKAGNPLYRCNDLTGRWVKVTNVNRRRTAVVPVEEPVAPITPATPATPVAPIVQRVNQGQRRQQRQQRQQMIRQLYSGMQRVLSSLSSPEELTKALQKLSVSQRRLLALRSEIQGARDMTDDQIFQQLRTRYTPSPIAPVVTPIVTTPIVVQQRRQSQEVAPPANENDDDEGFHVRPNFEIMALYQLQHYAREYNIRGRSGMTKPQLIRALTEHYNRYIRNAPNSNEQQIPRFQLETLETLRRYASAAGIPNRTGMYRNDLIRILRQRYPLVSDLPNINRDTRHVTVRERNNRRRTTSPVAPVVAPPTTPVVTPVVTTPVVVQQRRQSQEVALNNVRPNFKNMALYQLQHYAREYRIRGRSGMTKPELIRALTEHFDRYIPLPSFVPPPVRTPPVRTPVIEQQQTQDIQQQTQDIQIQQIPQQEQWWKTRCNNDDGTLQSQEWKDVSRKDVIRFQGYCFTLSEIYSLLHRAFTSVDTSYGIPPLRLQIPSEPFGRIPFRLPFFLELRKKATEDNLPVYPEVMYFLRYVRKFYAEDGPIHRFLSQIDPHKAQVSASIEKFLLNKNILQMVRSGQRANTEISWKFNNVISYQLTTPSSKLKYIQGKHW